MPPPEYKALSFLDTIGTNPPSLPVCKGFAFVTLTFLQDVNYILGKVGLGDSTNEDRIRSN